MLNWNRNGIRNLNDTNLFVWGPAREQRMHCAGTGGRERNITIACTFWSPSQMRQNMALSNIARCMWGQTHQVTHLTHGCAYWVRPLPVNFSLMHVPTGRSTMQYARRDASRLIERSGPAGSMKCRLLEIHRRMHHATFGVHLVLCTRPNSTLIERVVSCSIRRVTGIIKSSSCPVHQEP